MNKLGMIQEKIKQLKEKINDFSIQFVQYYKNESLVGVDDAFYTFAENEVSYFEDDQIDYFLKNEDSCLEGIVYYYGDFKAFASSCKTPRECICSAGMYGWLHDNVNILEGDKEVICTLLYLFNLLDFEEEIEVLEDERFSHFLASCNDVKAYDFCDFEYCDTFEEISEVLGFDR